MKTENHREDGAQPREGLNPMKMVFIRSDGLKRERPVQNQTLA